VDLTLFAFLSFFPRSFSLPFSFLLRFPPSSPSPSFHLAVINIHQANASLIIKPTSPFHLPSPWHSGEEEEVILASAGVAFITSKTQCQCGLHHRGLSRKHILPPPNLYLHLYQHSLQPNLQLATTTPAQIILNVIAYAFTVVVIIIVRTLIPLLKLYLSVLVVPMRMVKL